jgi:hypothetical protein
MFRNLVLGAVTLAFAAAAVGCGGGMQNPPPPGPQLKANQPADKQGRAMKVMEESSPVPPGPDGK